MKCETSLCGASVVWMAPQRATGSRQLARWPRLCHCSWGVHTQLSKDSCFTGLLCFSAWRKAQQCLRASIPSLPVSLHSAALYCYYFGYLLLSRGANRVSTKIEMLTGSFLNVALAGSMEGQGKVQTAGFVSQPPAV